MALREKLSVREISPRTGLSRNTIAKYLSAGTIEPTFTVPERPSKLDPFADKLAAWLKTEAGRSRKQRRTLKQLHADLMALGFTGAYGRVAAFAREWRVEQQTAGRGIMLSEHRDEAAASAFFARTIKTNGWPEKVVIDKSGANLAGLQNINWLLLLYGWFWLIEILQVKYLNNTMEQDHQFIKKLTRP